MKKSKSLKVIGIIFIIIMAIVVIGIAFIWSKLGKIKVEELDNNDLATNENLYNDVSNVVNKKEFDNIITVALFGIDEGRSDSIIIASLNPKTKSIKLISIPRDTYVTVSGVGKTKMNHAYAYGKEQLAIKTINSNFGLNITDYVTIDFKGMINVINKLGGIEFEISKEERDYINSRSQEAYDISGKTKINLNNYGKVLLDGEQTLTHVRNRTIGDDFTREERQRNALNSIANKMSSLGLNKILNIVDSLLSEVKTNLNITEYISIATELFSKKDEYLSNIISVQIPTKEDGQDKYISGVYYFVADLVKAKQDFIKYIYEK